MVLPLTEVPHAVSRRNADETPHGELMAGTRPAEMTHRPQVSVFGAPRRRRRVTLVVAIVATPVPALPPRHLLGVAASIVVATPRPLLILDPRSGGRRDVGTSGGSCGALTILRENLLVDLVPRSQIRRRHSWRWRGLDYYLLWVGARSTLIIARRRILATEDEARARRSGGLHPPEANGRVLIAHPSAEQLRVVGDFHQRSLGGVCDEFFDGGLGDCHSWIGAGSAKTIGQRSLRTKLLQTTKLGPDCRSYGAGEPRPTAQKERARAASEGRHPSHSSSTVRPRGRNPVPARRGQELAQTYPCRTSVGVRGSYSGGLGEAKHMAT